MALLLPLTLLHFVCWPQFLHHLIFPRTIPHSAYPGPSGHLVCVHSSRGLISCPAFLRLFYINASTLCDQPYLLHLKWLPCKYHSYFWSLQFLLSRLRFLKILILIKSKICQYISNFHVGL